MKFQGKIAIITGGANGIGKATATQFAEAGAGVYIWDLAEPAGNALAEHLRSAGYRAHYAQVDVSSARAVEAEVARIVETEGRIDILVNNAGILRDAQLIKYKHGEVQARMSDADFDAVINVNLRGVFVCTRAVAPVMIKQGSGRIINATSVVGLYGNFGQTNYVAAKSGVIGMTKVWAREFGRYGITVNAVAPGFVATDMLRTMPQKILDLMVARTPLGRMGQPEDIANAYFFLASEQASFITGHVLSVDGGTVVGT